MCMCCLGFALRFSSQTLKLKSKEGDEEGGGVDDVDKVGWVMSVGVRYAVPPGTLEVLHDGKAKFAA